jgi:hypothetical protein
VNRFAHTVRSRACLRLTSMQQQRLQGCDLSLMFQRLTGDRAARAFLVGHACAPNVNLPRLPLPTRPGGHTKHQSSLPVAKLRAYVQVVARVCHTLCCANTAMASICILPNGWTPTRWKRKIGTYCDAEHRAQQTMSSWASLCACRFSKNNRTPRQAIIISGDRCGRPGS